MNMNLRPKKDKGRTKVSVMEKTGVINCVNHGMPWKCRYFKAFSVSKGFDYISGHNFGGGKEDHAHT